MRLYPFLVALLVLSAAVRTLPDINGGEQGKPIAVADLMKVYKSGAAAFDKQFKGKTVVIEGIVESADYQPDFGGKRLLLVEGGGNLVRCVYTDTFEGLRMGHKLQVQGTCQGHSETLSAAELADCKVVKVFADDYPPSKNIRAEIARLQGKWKVIAMEVKGVKTEKAPAFNVIEIASHQLHLHQGDQLYPFGLSIQPDKSPKALNLHGAVVVPCIYSLEGDVLKLCLPDNPKARPESFATQGKQVTVLMARKEAGK